MSLSVACSRSRLLLLPVIGVKTNSLVNLWISSTTSRPFKSSVRFLLYSNFFVVPYIEKKNASLLPNVAFLHSLKTNSRSIHCKYNNQVESSYNCFLVRYVSHPRFFYFSLSAIDFSSLTPESAGITILSALSIPKHGTIPLGANHKAMSAWAQVLNLEVLYQQFF